MSSAKIASLFLDRVERIGFNFRIRIAQFRGQNATAVRPQRGTSV